MDTQTKAVMSSLYKTKTKMELARIILKLNTYKRSENLFYDVGNWWSTNILNTAVVNNLKNIGLALISLV